MSAAATDWALKQTTGNSTAKLVLLVLADVADGEGRTRYGQKKLAAMAELSVRTLQRHLSDLRDGGFLMWDERERPNGSQTTHEYQLNLGGRQNVVGGGDTRVVGGASPVSPLVPFPLSVSKEEQRTSDPDESDTPELPDPDNQDLALEQPSIFPDDQPKTSPPKKAKPDPSLFEDVWRTHPRGPKHKAKAEWEKAVTNGITHPELLFFVECYVDSFDPGFEGAHLFRWIRDHRWEELQAKGLEYSDRPTSIPAPGGGFYVG